MSTGVARGGRSDPGHALAARLQRDGTEAFVESWNDLIGVIVTRREALEQAG